MSISMRSIKSTVHRIVKNNEESLETIMVSVFISCYRAEHVLISFRRINRDNKTASKKDGPHLENLESEGGQNSNKNINPIIATGKLKTAQYFLKS